VPHPRGARPLIAVLIVGALLLTACRGDEAADPADDGPEALASAPLTGVDLEGEEATHLANRPLLIVKVDNSAQARPQVGLDRADVVFEELVEGGITRFMALFHSDLPDAVGPVRSARPVDVQLGSGFPWPVFAYSGARAEVQRQLAAAPMVSLSEGVAGFERAADRRAPHDLMVRPAEVLRAGLERGAEPLTASEFAFSTNPPEGDLACPEGASDCTDPGAGVTVAMSPFSRTGWTYEVDAGLYRRDQSGSPFLVTGEGRVGAANVVVLATRHVDGGCCDTSGSPYVDTEVIGGDRALVLRDGRRYEARWEKAEETAPLRVLTPDGDPFPLKPGPSWILLPDGGQVPA
jgi:hypothetical protein